MLMVNNIGGVEKHLFIVDRTWSDDLGPRYLMACPFFLDVHDMVAVRTPLGHVRLEVAEEDDMRAAECHLGAHVL